MTSRKFSGGNDVPLPRKLAVWSLGSSSAYVKPEFKEGPDPGSRSSSATVMETFLSEETCDSFSDEDQSPTFPGTVPKLSLPTLYEDEENPVTVKISCRKCLDMESILRNFTEMHVKAFATCREKRERFWEYLAHWNSKLRKTLDGIKCHLIGEFVSHIDQAPLSEFKEEHEFRVQFNYFRLVYTHLKSMENRADHRRQEIECSMKETYTTNESDKMLKDLQLKISSANLVLQQIEQRIRCIASSWDSARAATNPHGFRQAIFTKEDYIFNRLSNMFTCIDFLEREKKFYEEKARASVTVERKFLPVLQLQPRHEDNGPKPCNVKRRPLNSVKRKLTSAIAHFYPFVKSQSFDEVHASWYRTFLKPDEIRKELTKQRDTNMTVLLHIQQLKKDIHQLETQIKMKEYVEQTVKAGDVTEEVTMFPETSHTVPSFMDFNALLL